MLLECRGCERIYCGLLKLVQWCTFTRKFHSYLQGQARKVEIFIIQQWCMSGRKLTKCWFQKNRTSFLRKQDTTNTCTYFNIVKHKVIHPRILIINQQHWHWEKSRPRIQVKQTNGPEYGPKPLLPLSSQDRRFSRRDFTESIRGTWLLGGCSAPRNVAVNKSSSSLNMCPQGGTAPDGGGVWKLWLCRARKRICNKQSI